MVCKVLASSTLYMIVGVQSVAAQGSIVAWGDNCDDRCDVPPPNTGFTAVATGWAHVLGLQADGSIVAWGYNDRGQCDVPAPNTDFVAVAAGGAPVSASGDPLLAPPPHLSLSLGLKSDGSVVAWGDAVALPSPNSGFVAISAGTYRFLGLKDDGSIVVWGGAVPLPVPPPNADFVAVAAGFLHNLGLKEDGSVVAWGGNPYGQCDVPEPNTGFVAIAAGEFHSLGLKEDGSIVGWGDIHSLPSPNTGFVGVAAGCNHSLGLKADGSIVAWGLNDCGQCDVPAPNGGFAAVDATWFASVGLKGEELTAAEWTSFRAEERAEFLAVGPNPAGGPVTVRYSVPASRWVRLSVYDAAGRLIRVLRDGRGSAGEHAVTWSGRDGQGAPAASGVYFVRLTDERTTESRKVVLLR
jgi:hypothetical protein